MTATLGNPLADVARTSVIFKFGDIPEDKSYITKKLVNFFRGKFYKEYIRRYIEISDNHIEEIEKWELPVAAARLMEYLPKREKEKLVSFINERIYDI